ncbi:MAG: tripartite tricarboxylate transporter substrate binding protein [Candidatus Competibacteraceae bacterium]|nr:tripartite tricarboxylate transporter substrate binding protein [Candidatus Competibacteraceae bacterium]
MLKNAIRNALFLAGALSLSVHAQDFSPSKPECIAPAKPGGGFDITCRIAVTTFQELDLLDEPMRVTYMPGGIGAVAYNTVVAQRPDDPNNIVAFSAGSALNLALGKYGQFDEDDVRWLAIIGADYGVIAVKADSPYQNLKQLLEAVKENPAQVAFGAGGTVGSQDWMKVALVVKSAGVDPRQMRFVPFEGGGETTTALLGGHVQAISGDAAEMLGLIQSGDLRVLAVLNDERLEGEDFENIPTAREQGYDVVWETYRSFYTGPKVSDETYQFWTDAFEQVMETDAFAEIRQNRGLFPLTMVGEKAETYVKQGVEDYRELAREMGMIQ